MYSQTNKRKCTKSLVTANSAKPASRRVILEGQVRDEICLIHEEVGHCVKATYDAVIGRLYWNSILRDCKTFCQTCEKCQRNKQFAIPAPELHPIPLPQHALTQWGLDLMKLPKTEDGRENLRVAVEHLTKWVEARPLKSKHSSEIVAFIEDLCMRFSMPEMFITDQGSEFCNTDFDGFCTENGIIHRKTAAYHPQSNGLTGCKHYFL